MITIFTPTYNRAGLLPRVYDSLKKQTSSDFEWLIVDDGSTDNTKDLVTKWLDEADINIRYIYKENGGKHTAFNLGVQNAYGDLFFCVDSDDYLPEDCVESLIDANSSTTENEISGIIALKSDTSGRILSSPFPKRIVKTTTYALSKLYHCYGEKSLIYKTSVLKKYSYPEIPGERFIGECVVYDQIDQSYSMVLLDKVLTICEYQADGLTGSFLLTMLNNPTGYKIFYKQRIDMARTLRERIGYIIRYNAFDILSNNKDYRYVGKHRFAVTILKPLGWLLTKYYEYKKGIKQYFL